MSKTRIYEVQATIMAKPGGEVTASAKFLVDAKSQEAAERHVATKFLVLETSIPNSRRTAELVSSGIRPEPAE